MTATGPEGTAHTWTLPTDRHTTAQLLHAKAGETVTRAVPRHGRASRPASEFALFEVRGNDIRADRFDALAIKDGLLELRRPGGRATTTCG